MGGDLDGMGDLEDAPVPPMGADEQDPNMMQDPMADPNAMGGDPSQDPNAMADPNMMGGGDDISQKYQQLSPDQQKAADKYVDSMLNTESRNVIRKAIDETLGSLLDNGQDGVERPEKRLKKHFRGNIRSPYVPDL